MARIILIDDEDAVRRTVRLALITDIFMPGQDGIVTVRRIRKESPGVKVIVVSGGDSTGRLDLRKDAELLGAATSRRKPFSSAELLRAVRDVVGLGSEPPPRNGGWRGVPFFRAEERPPLAAGCPGGPHPAQVRAA